MVRRWVMVLVAVVALLLLPAGTASAATGYGGRRVSATNAEAARPRAAAVVPEQGLLPHIGSDGAKTLLFGGGVVLLVAGGVLLATRRGGGQG